MGWGRMLLLGNWGQQMDIEEQRQEIDRLRDEVRESRGEGDRAAVESLEAEIDEMRLYLSVLVRLVVARGVVSEAELRALVQAVDAEDGEVDGRHGGKVC